MSEENQEQAPAAEPAPDWADVYNTLPAEVQGMAFFKRGEDGMPPPLEQVVSGVSNMAKLHGNMAETHVRVPRHDDPPEKAKESLERAVKMIPGLRVAEEGEDSLPPADIEGYKIPEGTDPETFKEIREFALSHKWGQQQFTDFVGRMVADGEASASKQADWKESQAGVLSEKLGEAKESRIAQTLAAVEGLAPEGFVDNVKAGNVDAGVVLMLDGLVQKMLELGEEGSQFVKQVGAGARTLTPIEHQQRAMELSAELQDMRPHDPLYNEKNAERMKHIARSNPH